MKPGNADRKLPERLKPQRNGLLALVHVAKKELGLDDDSYRLILRRFGVGSAGKLNIAKLEALVAYFESIGFVKKKSGARCQVSGVRNQAAALRERIEAEAAKLENGTVRVIGLVKKIAQVDRLEWCRDVGKLKRILKILGQLE